MKKLRWSALTGYKVISATKPRRFSRLFAYRVSGWPRSLTALPRIQNEVQRIVLLIKERSWLYWIEQWNIRWCAEQFKRVLISYAFKKFRNLNQLQWEIQDFPDGERQPQRWGSNLLFGQFPPKTACKRKHLIKKGYSFLDPTSDPPMKWELEQCLYINLTLTHLH